MRAWAGAPLHIEPEEQHVALLHHILLALQPQRAGLLGAGVALVLDEVIKADGLGADEALGEGGARLQLRGVGVVGWG
jgi:hypothetical protein